MVKSQSSDVSNLSSFCSIESVRRNEENREEIRKRLPSKITVAHYLETKDLPKWFRVLSDIQLKAADSLTESIRDDMDQNTTHRCRDILLRIGLSPLEPSKNIKFVINLSRGNDLAFLWFLMELFYTDTCSECNHTKTEYNTNQQLLMSAIAHLDMVLTLRTLDKILPPRPKREPRKRPTTRKPKKQTYLSPYLQPLPRPVIGPSLKKRPPIPEYPAARRYAQYLDPHYTLPNEWNRWYALPEEEQKLLDFGFDMSTEGDAIVTRILKAHLKSIFSATLNRKDIWRALCPTHIRRLEEEERQAKIEKVKKRAEVKRHFSLKERKRIRAKKIAAQLEADAERIQEERNEQLEYEEFHTWMKCFINDLIWQVTTPQEEEEITSCPLDKSCSIIPQKSCTQSKKPICQCSCYRRRDYEEPFDLDHFGTPKPNEIYFQAAGQNKPYVFYYHNIFKDDVAEKNDPIKSALSNALDLKEHDNEDEAISSWLKKSWEEEVKNFNEEWERKQHREAIVQNDQQQHYDGRDRDLMDDMLHDAISMLRKNPKYVLVSLPEAYKHPVLRRWIMARYCEAYPFTKKEKENAVEMTRRLFDAVRRAHLNVTPPREDEIGTRKVMSYACRNYVYFKTKRTLQEYFHTIKTLVMEDVRVYAQLMEPMHCSVLPWTTFYDYLPSREYDVLPFRPWQVNEYMDAKKEWLKRKEKKRYEEKFKL